MKFKRIENNMIWESYGDNNMSDDVYDNQEESEFVLQLEPDGPMTPEFEDHDEHESHDEKDDDSTEYTDMVYADLKKLDNYSTKLMEYCRSGELEPWMVAKIIKASDYISDIWHSLDANIDYANDRHPDVKF
jgi:hypothetical protein